MAELSNETLNVISLAMERVKATSYLDDLLKQKEIIEQHIEEAKISLETIEIHMNNAVALMPEPEKARFNIDIAWGMKQGE